MNGDEATTHKVDEAMTAIDELASVGIVFDDVMALLERHCVDKFAVSAGELVETVEGKMVRSSAPGSNA